MNSMTAFPSECDSEVGGVLTRLLEPAVVDAKADEMEDDDEEADGELVMRVGIAVTPLTAKISALFCMKAGSVRGADVDKPLGGLGALELRLPTVPLV